MGSQSRVSASNRHPFLAARLLAKTAVIITLCYVTAFAAQTGFCADSLSFDFGKGRKSTTISNLTQIEPSREYESDQINSLRDEISQMKKTIAELPGKDTSVPEIQKTAETVKRLGRSMQDIQQRLDGLEAQYNELAAAESRLKSRIEAFDMQTFSDRIAFLEKKMAEAATRSTTAEEEKEKAPSEGDAS